MRLKDVQAQMDRVMTDERIARAALERLNASLIEDPGLIHQLHVERADFRECRRSMERTYLVRLFAVFEWALHNIWSALSIAAPSRRSPC